MCIFYGGVCIEACPKIPSSGTPSTAPASAPKPFLSSHRRTTCRCCRQKTRCCRLLPHLRRHRHRHRSYSFDGLGFAPSIVVTPTMLGVIRSPIRRRFQLRTLLRRSRYFATSTSDFVQNAVLDTMSCYDNDWKRALEFFHWVPQHSHFNHTVDTFNKMIDILGKFFEYDLVWQLIRQMGSNAETMPDHTTFRILFKRYAAAHLVLEAIDAYHRSEQYGLKDKETFFNLVDSLCEYKHVVEVGDLLSWWSDLRGEEMTKFHNLMLRGWFRMGWWGKCRECWEEMGKLGIKRDLHSYSVYMNILCKSGKPWKAVKLYKEMKKKRIELDAVAYNIVVQAVGICDGVDRSIRVLREMSDLGCRPNVVTYNTVIRLLCEAGRFKHAWELVRTMRNDGCAPNAITFHCFFKFLNKPKDIMSLFDRMLERGPAPTMETYVMLIKKFGRWGFLRPVFTVWKKMEKQGLSPDAFAYNAFIDALVQKGMVEMARAFDEEMMGKGLSAKLRKELDTKISTDLSEEEEEEELGMG